MSSTSSNTRPGKHAKPSVKSGTRRSRVINPNAAGIDVGAHESYVAVPPERDTQPVRSFGCFTEDLHALADWLIACGVTSVALESTGVYWVPIFQILETRGLEVYLVNARHVKSVPGRKTDVLDCQWLQELHSFGLLAASFRPADDICVLRSYWRHRDSLVRYAAAHSQHMQKALEQMNIQLHKVISDITGVTGLRIIDAILAGQRDRRALAALKDYRIASSQETIAKALDGDYRPEHLFALRQARDLYQVYRQKISECDTHIEQYLTQLDSKVDPIAKPPPPCKRGNKKPEGNQVSFDLRTHLYRISGVDFTQIEGFDTLTIQTILSEVGLSATRFPTCKHFVSWLCLCPDNRITGGKVKNSKTRKSKNRAADAFRLAAQAVGNSTGPLGSFYRRLKSRLGAPKAITATAHKLARIFYSLWKDPQRFDLDRLALHEHQNTLRTINYLRKKAASLGFDLVPQLVANPEVS